MLNRIQPLPFIDQFEHKIALDTGSTDGTIEILQERGWTVFESQWEDDYSRARNELIELVQTSRTGPKWLLMLDADEAIWAKDVAAIWDICKTTKADLLTFPRINLAGKCDVREVGSYPDPQARCIRIGSSVRYKLPVHEVVESEGETVKGIHIYHYSWTKPIAEIWLRSHNYMLIAKGEPTLNEAPDWVRAISEREFWKGMGQRHKFAPFDKPHPLKENL